MSHREAASPRPAVGAVLPGLKGFQRATVEYAFHRLYLAPDSTRRFLVADEVGLGKTLVARGVIAKAIDHLWEGIDRIDVVYICSNAQIADPERTPAPDRRRGSSSTADRLTLLPTAIGSLRQQKVNYLAFTPGTSFDMKRRLGRREERALLYHLVQRVWPDPRVRTEEPVPGQRRRTSTGWRRQLDGSASGDQIDPDLARGIRPAAAAGGQEPRVGRRRPPRRSTSTSVPGSGGLRSQIPEEDRTDQAALYRPLADRCSPKPASEPWSPTS